MQTAPYLTVAEAAGELGITPGGVYKLIERGHLKAVRKTARTIRISRLALDAYRRRFEDEEPDAVVELHDGDVRVLRQEFEDQVGVSPAEWERRWKAGEVKDTAENMSHAIRALALILAEREAVAETQTDVTEAEVVAAALRLDGVISRTRPSSRSGWVAKNSSSGRVVGRSSRSAGAKGARSTGGKSAPRKKK